MSTRGNRTVICSVVFIDIIEYSKRSVPEQMQAKEQFNRLLADALVDVHTNDRIILDTGDGAAISFLGDPEEALFLALALRDAIASRRDHALQLRIGINLGPVRLVKDINGQPNIIGDGINVAQRIMSFAEVNQVLASRSYYEVISALSADYAHLFTFEGARTDKHVRDHEVYSLGNAPAPERTPRKPLGPAAAHAGAALRRLDAATSTARAQVMRRPLVATTLAVALILVLAVALRLALRGGDAQPTAPVTAQAPTQKPTLPKPRVAEQTPPEPVAKPVTPPPPKKIVSAKKAAEARAPEQAPERPIAAATGTVRVNILPWGEIYVDGNKYGIAPPLRDIALKPGQYRIEVRNPGFASYVQVVDVSAGEEIRIRHRFR